MFYICIILIYFYFVSVQCDLPVNITHGSLTDKAYYYQDVLVYQCDDGYFRASDTAITCQSNGSWSSTATCHSEHSSYI